MGYRLEISKTSYAQCGGKLYGYIKNLEELNSYKWLVDNLFIEPDSIFNYGFNPKIVMSSIEFEEFIKLYILDWKELYDEDISDRFEELIRDTSDKVLEWY